MQKHAIGNHSAAAVSSECIFVGELGVGFHVLNNKGLNPKFQTALRVIYPPRCVACGDMVESDFGLCSDCWKETPFVGGTVCMKCGTPLLGSDMESEAQCDACMAHPRPWAAGRAALRYSGVARKMILALKYGDRQEVARPASKWLARVAAPILPDDFLIAPVPLHWMRHLKRRYNQAAVLAQAFAREIDAPYCPDLLIRPRGRGSMEGLSWDARFEKMAGAIEAHPKRARHMKNRTVVLVDDVMTSGATLSAATLACLGADAKDVRIVTLACVAKDP